VIKNKFIIILLLAVLTGIFYNESFAQYNSLIIKGKSSIVNIDDILKDVNGGYTEADIKRICAKITERYHIQGYTAFYIRKAILNKEGTVELFFNESIVKDISITGVPGRSTEISSSIFKKGDVFNEFILRDNITSTRKKYNLKYINVSIKRADDEQVLLNIKVSEKSDKISFGISSSPVYGIMPEAGFSVNYGMFHAGVSLVSSLGQKETSSTEISVFFRRDMRQDKSGLILSSDYSQREDSFYNNTNLIYEQKSVTSRGGLYLLYGAARFDFLVAGVYDILKYYPGIDGGNSFSGIELRFNYNDAPFKIDYDDMTSCGIDFFSGWNFIEDIPVCRVSADYKINIPVFPGFFLSFNGSFSWTSDTERFLQFYVFDQDLPCRNDDLTFSSWKNVTGIDLVMEVLKRTLYIGPCFKWGLHNSDEELNTVYTPGIKGLVLSEKVKIELSYFYDMNHAVKEGYFFMAAVGYL